MKQDVFGMDLGGFKERPISELFAFLGFDVVVVMFTTVFWLLLIIVGGEQLVGCVANQPAAGDG